MDENIKENSQEDFLKLQKLDAKEVSKATHIEQVYIEYILNKDFQKLTDHNVKGFIRIIEREYGLKLQPWLDEYNSFRGDHSAEDKAAIREVVAKNISSSSVLPSSSYYNNRNYNWIFWFLLLIILVACVFYFKLYKILDSFPNPFEDKNRSATYSNATVVSKVEKQLENVGISMPKFDENKTFIQIPNVIIKENNDTNNSFKNALDRSIDMEKNQTLNDSNATFAVESPSEKDIKIVTLIPEDKMWIGTIYLSDKQKNTVTTDKPYEIDLSKNQLILTGHGVFSLDKNGEKENFKEKNPLRLLVKDGNITKISYDEFLKFNNGKAW